LKSPFISRFLRECRLFLKSGIISPNRFEISLYLPLSPGVPPVFKIRKISPNRFEISLYLPLSPGVPPVFKIRKNLPEQV